MTKCGFRLSLLVYSRGGGGGSGGGGRDGGGGASLLSSPEFSAWALGCLVLKLTEVSTPV